MQHNLFDQEYSVPVPAIEGLTYIPDFITHTQETELSTILNNQPWLTDLKRRVQHYGWKYDYKTKHIDQSMKIGIIPDWVMPYCHLLVAEGLFSRNPDQVIINEYIPGQGIAPHIDCIPCFGETIASLSLSSPCVMDFVNNSTHVKQSLLLEPCSILVLQGEARYQWQHGIAARKTDTINGYRFSRNTRLSMTFRNVILP